LVLGGFGVVANSGFTLSSYNQTQNYLVNGTGVSNGFAMVLGNAAGASSLTFSTTSSTSSGLEFSGVTVELEN
jgi:hypothetical protein